MSLYIDLLKRVLIGDVYRDDTFKVFPDRKIAPYNRKVRHDGGDWPTKAPTMIGMARLDNIEHCAMSIFKDGIRGDFAECGVWRGGASIFMAALIAENAFLNRRVWVCDSFEGMPIPRHDFDRGCDLTSLNHILAVSLDEVRQNFEDYNLLNERVQFVQGWFRDSLPKAPIDKLALLRCDGDLYESTMDTLTSLYPKLQPGGYCIIDDFYNVIPCNRAVEEYRTKHHITDEIIKIDWAGAFWRKS